MILAEVPGWALLGGGHPPKGASLEGEIATGEICPHSETTRQAR
jgi:hypothetical protein